MNGEAVGIVLQYGLAGVGLIVLAYAVIKLYNKVVDLQEKRLDDAKEVTNLVVEPLKKQGELSDKMYEILVSIRDNSRRK